MTNKEAIAAIIANYPPENYTILREALDKAINLLKAQEALKPVQNEEKYGDALSHCPLCEKSLPNKAIYGKSKFCYHCGQAVKWE